MHAARSPGSTLLSARPRQGAPHRLKFGDRANLLACRFVRFLEDAPDHRQILRTHLRLRRDARQRGARRSQRGPVFESPRGLKVIRIIGGLAFIEADDPLDRVAVAIRFHQHRMGREIEPVRREHHVIAHFARRLQVFVEQRGRHGQRLAGVVEAGRIGGIHRKFAGGSHVHAGQVADGVVVLGVAEAARQHRPGIAGVLPRLVHAYGLHPVDHLLTGRIRRLGRRLRWHLPRGKFLQHQIPAGIVPGHGGHRGVRPEIELRGRRGTTVASDAVAGEKGPDGLCECAIQIGIGGVGCPPSRKKEASG